MAFWRSIVDVRGWFARSRSAGDAGHAVPPVPLTLTRHDTGLTLDIPLPPDPREPARRRAWRLFEVGILLLVSILIGYVALDMTDRRAQQPWLGIPFVVGIVLLAAAASKSWSGFREHDAGKATRQLSVVGDMLLRTTRDEVKQIWYRHEIHAIAARWRSATGSPSAGETATTWAQELVLTLKTAESILLASATAHSNPSDDLATDFFQAAREFQAALQLPRSDGNEPDSVDHAIHIKEARITR